MQDSLDLEFHILTFLNDCGDSRFNCTSVTIRGLASTVGVGALALAIFKISLQFNKFFDILLLSGGCQQWENCINSIM